MDLYENFFRMKIKSDLQYGLYNGKMGICLAAFIMERLLNDSNMRKEAENILTDILDNVDKVPDYGFGAGLTGIGWGIEWIIRNRYQDGDSSEILEDLDDELYKLVVFSKCDNITLEDGTLGRALYFFKRIESNKEMGSRYRKMCLMECLVLLLDELCDTISTSICQSANIENSSAILNFSRCLVFLSKTLPLRLNTEKVRKTIYEQVVWALDNSDRLKKHNLFWRSVAYAGMGLKEVNVVSFANCKISNETATDLQYLSQCSETFAFIESLTNHYGKGNFDNWQEGWLC